MSRYAVMAAQLELLVNQRAQLTSNRYCALKQLRQHDETLCLASSWLYQQTTEPQLHEQSPWLKWLLSSNDQSLLAFAAVQQLEQPLESWLLLHQVKQRLFVNIAVGWQAEMMQVVTADTDIPVWTLAHYLSLHINPLDTAVRLTPAAMWYLIMTASAGQMAELEAKCFTDEQMRVLWALMLSGSSEQQSTLSTFSPAVIIENIMQHRQALPLLMAAADTALRGRLINYLASIDQRLAIEAMGYSGQLKFIPLLIELAQQQDLYETAADALALLLGTIESDNYLSEPELSQRLNLTAVNGHYLCGKTVSESQLAFVLKSGSCMQRQMASCLRKYLISGCTITAADRLQVSQ